MFGVQILLSHQEILILKELLNDEMEALQYKISRCKDRKAGRFQYAADQKEIWELEKQAKQRLIMMRLTIFKMETLPDKTAYTAF